MSVFVLVPGAGGAAWYWHRVIPELTARGHDAVAVDLPGPDESAGLPEYAEAVTAAIGGRRDVVVVGQSMGAFTAPVACARAPARLLVLVNAMIPRPGETPGEWWGHTGWEPARIAAAEGACGRRLPAAVREWYTLAGAEELLTLEESLRYELLSLAIEEHWDRQQVRAATRQRST